MEVLSINLNNKKIKWRLSDDIKVPYDMLASEICLFG